MREHSLQRPLEVPEIGTSSLALPTQPGTHELSDLWQAARADKTPGVCADNVLDRLEHKHQALAEAQDHKAK